MAAIETTQPTATDNDAPANAARKAATALLAEEYARMDEERALMESLRPGIELCCRVAAELPESVRARVHFSAINRGTWIHMTVTAADQIVAVRRIASAHGLHLATDGFRDHPEDMRQVHELVQEGSAHRTFLDFRFPSTPAQGQTCAYVQTGTKTVPTYELRCSEGAPT